MGSGWGRGSRRRRKRRTEESEDAWAGTGDGWAETDGHDSPHDRHSSGRDEAGEDTGPLEVVDGHEPPYRRYLAEGWTPEAPDDAPRSEWPAAQVEELDAASGYGEDAAYQDGSYQDGSYPEGSYQDGSYQDGSYQDGSYQDGTHQEGSYPEGAYQDGAYQEGVYGEGVVYADTYADAHADEAQREAPPETGDVLADGWSSDGDPRQEAEPGEYGPHTVDAHAVDSQGTDPHAVDHDAVDPRLIEEHEAAWTDDDGGRRGFLGSGWRESPDPDDELPGKRRRGRVLTVAAVMIVGVVAAGVWLTSGGSSDCSDGTRCASERRPASVVDDPSAGAGDDEGETVPTDEPTADSTAGPGPKTPRPTATREDRPSARPTATRPSRTTEPTPKATATAKARPKNTGLSEEPETDPEPSAAPPTRTESQAPVQPAPSDTPRSGGGGLLDWLF